MKKFIEWIKKVWALFLKWGKETALAWILKSWLQIVNVLIVLYAYGKLDDAAILEKFPSGPAALVGFWAFILLAYCIFWKFFGADKVIMPMLKKLCKKIFGEKCCSDKCC